MRLSAIFLFAVISWAVTLAQTRLPNLRTAVRAGSPAIEQAADSSKAMTNADVEKMVQAGLSDQVVVDAIRRSPSRSFDLGPDALIELKQKKVSDAVIDAMINPTKSDSTSASSTSGSSASDRLLPSEVGIYAKKKGQWVDVNPEIVNWKSGGMMKTFMSGGIVKPDVNGHIPGKNSINSFTTPIDFVIVAPEGVAPTEYQLLHLHENADSREFRTFTGGIVHSEGGATRDLVPFESKKIAPRTYSVIFPATMAAGEYGFLPPGAYGSASSVSMGKIYSFRIVE